MISIIICSINSECCEKTIWNFSETIGVEYETIVFDNRSKNWGICKVYNYCAEKAKYPYLCFVHEDVFIKTKDWGKEIIKFIETMPNCGVVGFAGGLRARKNLFSWYDSPERVRVNVYDGCNNKDNRDLKTSYKNHIYVNPNGDIFSQVLCIDGLCHIVKKKYGRK
jgi:hypothetical protein